MGKIVTVMNMKGGVGKTTVAMHFGGIASRYKIGAKYRKVLLIDYDPQFNLSQAYLSATAYQALEHAKRTTLSILVDHDSNLNPYEIQTSGSTNPPSVTTIAHTLFHTTKHDGLLHIVPSKLDLMYVALGQTAAQAKVIEERFRKFIDECRNEYDLTLIDCHPAGSLFTKTSLRNSDHVLIPVTPQKYATRGIGLMINFINAKKHGNNGPTPHIVFNDMPRSGTSAVETSIRNNPDLAPLCMANSLKHYKAFSDPRGRKWTCLAE